MNNVVYLGGHVVGVKDVEEWRYHVIESFDVMPDIGISFINPLDNNEAIYEDGIIVRSKNEKASFSRCMYQIAQCNICLFNLSLSEKVSTGSIFEMGWAYANNKHIITIVNNSTLIHPFITYGSNVIFHDINEAIEYLIFL